MVQSPSKPATEVNFSHVEEAQAWFQNQSREVCIALAMRSALRLLPLMINMVNELAPASIILPVLRLNFVTWAIGKYPSQHERLRTCISEAFDDHDLLWYYPPNMIQSIILAARAAAAVVVDQNISYIAHRDWQKKNTWARVTFENIYARAAYAVTVGNAAFDNAAFVQADAVAVEQRRAIAEIVAAPL